MCRINYTFAICVMLWVPIASGQQTSAAIPQPVGPTIPVKMIDAVDSSLDSAGKQYRAGVIRPINIGNGVMVAQGSPATAVLVKNGSGWSVQLSSLVIKDQVTTVTSNPGTVIRTAVDNKLATAANAANAVLGGFGRKPNTYSPAAVVAMGDRVILPPGISLSFVMNAIPSLMTTAPMPSSTPSAHAANTAPAAPAQPPPAAQPAAQVNSSAAGPGGPSQAQKQRETFCSATYSPDSSHITHYRSGVFQFTGGRPTVPGELPGHIGGAWNIYILNTYNFPVNAYVAYDCYNLWADPGGQRTIATMEQSWKFDKGKIVYVDWKYTPGAEYASLRPVAAAGHGVTPPPPAVAEVPAYISLLYCRAAVVSGNPEPFYVSAPFTGPGNMDTRPVLADFIKFVVAKYSVRGNLDGACYTDIPQRDRDLGKQNVVPSVDTGWKPTVAPPSQHVKNYLIYCSSRTGPDTYVSDKFEVPPFGSAGLGMIQIAFHQFLHEKYSLPTEYQSAPVGCGMVAVSRNDIPAVEANIEADAREGKKIVKTGWKYVGTLPPPEGRP
jgi:hypothetical protein